MGPYSLTVESARVRAGAWRGDPELAYLVPLTGAATLSPRVLERIHTHLVSNGFREVVTAAVGPSERDAFAADGYHHHEALHLLRHELSGPLPPASRPGYRMRRGSRRDRPEILEVDATAFNEFWQLDTIGLREAISATPRSRVRVCTDNDGRIVGYSVTGRADTNGYLQRLAVDPDHHRQGIGTALVGDALRWLRRHHAAVAWVNTQEANSNALALYTHLGFRPADHQLTVLRRVL